MTQYAPKCLQHAEALRYRPSSPSCMPRTKAAAYSPLQKGSSPGVSWPRPHRGSRKMLMLGAQNVSPAFGGGGGGG